MMFRTCLMSHPLTQLITYLNLKKHKHLSFSLSDHLYIHLYIQSCTHKLRTFVLNSCQITRVQNSPYFPLADSALMFPPTNQRAKLKLFLMQLLFFSLTRRWFYMHKRSNKKHDRKKKMTTHNIF